MKYLRQLYDWVLTWADRPSGPTALGIMSIAESSFFPIPPDVLLIPLALGKRKKAFRFALICSVGSILGAAIGYGIGHWVWWNSDGSFSIFAQFFFKHIPGFSQHAFDRIESLYDTYKFMIVFTAGFTPIPFKIFTISAGAFNINFLWFMIASIVSRSARFYLVAGLIQKFGNPIRDFIDKYFNLLAIGLTILFFGGFAFLKLII
ncbi:MAG: DedA family protein [Candidatus Marinimicrobia bacterium]|jgi:membrane protein YqaA with SNARE-associated domain|nr:DedA family protein [Candidatus Neomarinimicrobiota bacterium]MBT3946522.1 DedA family protein [Candidatus Neomarinimicrobiota bacterium]MBT4154698.1 DedA family protein [Candidatus Neomarinimicrobiota bacterium]MBT4554963.1 DedA family protein [Candidatus Neomarinimicrobiota bacterium]MBT4753249.1 DedA family protein [Candidatus Neomarinimicrobiota bacterium]|tara:strand:+ start:12748 stop:13362 length:615 start_codon:yes stop_codon:yes gene_type:complete